MPYGMIPEMKNETKLFLGIIVGTVALVAGAVLIFSRPAAQVRVDASLLVRPDSHSTATQSAAVVLVEFSDYQCPACRTYYPMVKQIERDFSGSLAFVYRNFPLTNIHRNAQTAAEAAEAAGMQGKYWEMNDKLFATQNEWSAAESPKDTFVGYAKSLGLDAGKFSRDMDSDAVKQKIQKDVDDGNALGLTGTPTFYLNNVKIDNPAGLADFEALIRKAIDKGRP